MVVLVDMIYSGKGSQPQQSEQNIDQALLLSTQCIEPSFDLTMAELATKRRLETLLKKSLSGSSKIAALKSGFADPGAQSRFEPLTTC